MFLYSQDLSNCTTEQFKDDVMELFLYSQDLSNCTTLVKIMLMLSQFLYSQDLSNCTTYYIEVFSQVCFCTLKI